MTDLIFKTPQNLIKESISRKYNRLLESDSASVTKTASGDQELDVGARRSPRNVGKSSAVKKFHLSPKMAYPGSGSKPQGKRSFRTPVQALPLKSFDGKAVSSASKSFAVLSDQSEMETPRSVVEGLLATAESQPRTHFIAPETSQRRAAAETLLPRTSRRKSLVDDSASSKRTSHPTAESPTPGSKLTPRTNVWNLLNNVMNETVTPAVRNEDHSHTPSAERNVSSVKHGEWGQVVTLSPLSFAETSGEGEGSPAFSKKSLKRTRRSFHIQVPPKKVKVFQEKQDTAIEERQVPSDFGSYDDNLESVPPSNVLEKGMPIGSDHIGSSDPDIDDILLSEAVVGASRNLSYMSMKEISSFLMEEDDGLIEEEGANALKVIVEKERHEEANSLIVSRSSITEMDEEEGRDALKVIVEKERHEIARGLIVSQSGSTEMDVAAVDIVYEKRKVGEVENVTQVEIYDNDGVNLVNDGSNNIDACVDKVNRGNIVITHDIENREFVGSRQNELNTEDGLEIADDVNKNDYFGNNVGNEVDIGINNDGAYAADEDADASTGIGNYRDSGTVGLDELRKEKNVVGSRISSLASKHGEISFSASPRKSPKTPPMTQASSHSVYNLSDESNTSGEIYVPKHTSESSRNESPTFSTKKRRQSSLASTEKKWSAKNRLSGSARSFQNRSTLSYSEWKSLQKGKNDRGQSAISFNDMHPPRSSTPANRRKKILHSTKLQNSHFAQASDEQTSEVVPLPDISPIHPAFKRMEQKIAKKSRLEGIGADSDKEYDSAEGDPVQGFKSRLEREVVSDQEESDDDSLGLSPLATPHIDMDKRSRVMSTGKISLVRQPALEGPSGLKLMKKKKIENRGQPKKTVRRAPSATALPLRSVKFFAERRSTMKLSKDAVEEIAEVSEIFWDNTFKALEAYALHAGRKIINEEDAILLMKRQRLVNDQEDLYDKIREYLPMDQRIELIDLLQSKKK